MFLFILVVLNDLIFLQMLITGEIFFIAKKFPFIWENIIEEAKNKDLWVEPIEISKMIKEFPVKLLNPIKWVTQPELKQTQGFLALISEDILKGGQNSLIPKPK